VTHEDGSFKIDNIPLGTYALAAWHELYGAKEQTITIEKKTGTDYFLHIH